jgi:hypothetical protein
LRRLSADGQQIVALDGASVSSARDHGCRHDVALISKFHLIERF